MKVTIIQNGVILADSVRATIDDEGYILAEATLSTSDVKKLKRYACTLLIQDEDSETTTELTSRLNACIDDDTTGSLRDWQLSFDGFPVVVEEEPVEEEEAEEPVEEVKPRKKRTPRKTEE